MIVNCPKCQTRYLVDPAVLRAGGRVVRCAKCGGKWHQKPSADFKLQPPVEAPTVGGWAKDEAEIVEDEPVSPAAQPAQEPVSSYRFQPPAVTSPKRNILKKWGGWLLLAVVLILLSTGLVFFKEEMIKIWPPITRLYRLVGLVPLEEKIPLQLLNTSVKTSRPTPESQPVLIVSGDIMNGTAAIRAVPKLRVIFRSTDKKIVYETEFDAEKPSLAPGEAAHYEISVPEQPKAATTEVTFIAVN